MSRPGPRRIPISVKVHPDDLPRIDALAAAAGGNRSDWLRHVMDRELNRHPEPPPDPEQPPNDDPTLDFEPPTTELPAEAKDPTPPPEPPPDPRRRPAWRRPLDTEPHVEAP